MHSIKGTFKNGQVVLAEATDWPDGAAVVVHLAQTRSTTGMSEDEQGDDPESIAAWLAEHDAIPALKMTPEEEADWLTWRREVKRHNVEAVRRQMEIESE